MDMPKNFNKLLNKATKNQPKPSNDFGKNNMQNNPEKRNKSASNLGGEFYNPYGFIPFPQNKPQRDKISGLTIDETETERLSGVLSLKIKTVSPLLSLDPESNPDYNKSNAHKKYKALTIGNDVILPATSVRGSLQSLMTIITGGTLGYLDNNLWLCQGRDLVGKGELQPVIAKVVKAGNDVNDGIISIGEKNHFVLLDALKRIAQRNSINIDEYRPKQGKKIRKLFIDKPWEPSRISQDYSAATPWEVKLSGARIGANKPKYYIAEKEVALKSINKKLDDLGVHLQSWPRPADGIYGYTDGTGSKESPITSFSPTLDATHTHPVKKAKIKEAAYKKDSNVGEIKVDKHFWSDYQGRNRNGDKTFLEEGDLIWVFPKDNVEHITSDQDIRSLQWARWGREGQKLENIIKEKHTSVYPDYLNQDGLVDVVSDLFGQITAIESGISFASRIRPHNLIFKDCKKLTEQNTVTLAPMGIPHPGCIPFYRTGKSNDISRNSPLNGYKVYRNSIDEDTPWKYDVQGCYDEKGNLKDPCQNMNKTVDLVPKNQEGCLKISFRALKKQELAILLAVCSTDWKLGGGKPLGLGHCKVIELICEDELGNNLISSRNPSLDSLNCLDNEYQQVFNSLRARITEYESLQNPVENLRYPRAVSGPQKNGAQWFAKMAATKKNSNNECVGMQPFDGTIEGQILGNGKKLYGYDHNLNNGGNRESNQSTNRNTRQEYRRNRNQ